MNTKTLHFLSQYLDIPENETIKRGIFHTWAISDEFTFQTIDIFGGKFGYYPTNYDKAVRYYDKVTGIVIQIPPQQPPKAFKVLCNLMLRKKFLINCKVISYIFLSTLNFFLYYWHGNKILRYEYEI